MLRRTVPIFAKCFPARLRGARSLCWSAWVVLTAACSSGDVPIRIGVAGPFAQARGESMQLAVQLAVDEINAGGGVRGRPIEAVFRDDDADVERAVDAAQAFYDDPRVVAVIGHLTSGTTLAAAPIYNGGSRPLLEISPSASNPRVTGAGPFTFRICPTDLVHGARLAEWGRDRLEARRAAVFYLNDDYGRGVRTLFSERFTAAGGTLVADDPYLDDLPSFEPYVRRLSRLGGADVLMIAGTRSGAERILPALNAVGVRAAVMGGDGLSGLEAAGAIAEGVFISTAYLPDREGERNATFVASYRQAFDGRDPDHRGAGAYDIVHLLARALDAVGPHRAAVRDYVAGIGRATDPFEGVTGQISFDENGDVPSKAVVIGVVRAGRLVTAGQ